MKHYFPPTIKVTDTIAYFGTESFRAANTGLTCVIHTYLEWYGKILRNILRVSRMMLHNRHERVTKKTLGRPRGNWHQRTFRSCSWKTLRWAWASSLRGSQKRKRTESKQSEKLFIVCAGSSNKEVKILSTYWDLGTKANSESHVSLSCSSVTIYHSWHKFWWIHLHNHSLKVE